ncbi:unnamed protein product [Arctogadus glacialis]
MAACAAADKGRIVFENVRVGKPGERRHAGARRFLGSGIPILKNMEFSLAEPQHTNRHVHRRQRPAHEAPPLPRLGGDPCTPPPPAGGLAPTLGGDPLLGHQTSPSFNQD